MNKRKQRMIVGIVAIGVIGIILAIVVGSIGKIVRITTSEPAPAPAVEKGKLAATVIHDTIDGLGYSGAPEYWKIESYSDLSPDEREKAIAYDRAAYDRMYASGEREWLYRDYLNDDIYWQKIADRQRKRKPP